MFASSLITAEYNFNCIPENKKVHLKWKSWGNGCTLSVQTCIVIAYISVHVFLVCAAWLRLNQKKKKKVLWSVQSIGQNMPKKKKALLLT